MATETIRQFLVELGFHQDEVGLKKFSDSIASATKVVINFAEAVGASAMAVAAGVYKMTSNLEQLYFASKRTGASAENIKAFTRAAQEMGISAESAMGVLDTLRSLERTNPAARSIIMGQFGGVDILDQNGKKRDIEEVAEDIARYLKTLPEWVAQMKGGNVGISEEGTRFLQENPEGTFRKFHEMANRQDLTKKTAEAHDFMGSLRGLGDSLETFAIKVNSSLIQQFGGGIKDLKDWLDKNGDQLAGEVTGLIKEIITWVKDKLIPALKLMREEFNKLDGMTDGWTHKLALLATVLTLLGGGPLIAGIVALGLALSKIALTPVFKVLKYLGGKALKSMFGEVAETAAAAEASAAAAEGAAAAGTVGLLGGAAGLLGFGAAGGVGLGYLLDKLLPEGSWFKRAGNGIGGFLFNEFNKEGAFANAVNTFTNQGWGLMQSQSMAAVLQSESGLNPYRMGENGEDSYGIGQWHADRRADYEKRYGHKMGAYNDFDKDLQEQLDFVNYELHDKEKASGTLMKYSQSYWQSLYNFTRGYERPQDSLEEVDHAKFILQQTTHINVDGTGDPQAVAKHVAAEQHRVNADIVRENVPKVQ